MKQNKSSEEEYNSAKAAVVCQGLAQKIGARFSALELLEVMIRCCADNGLYELISDMRSRAVKISEELTDLVFQTYNTMLG